MQKLSRIEDLAPDRANANRGTKRGLDLLERSLEDYGAGRGAVVDKHGNIVAGNKTINAAREKGFEIEVVKTDGRKLVIIQREDFDLYDPKDKRAREYAYADNRVAQVDLEWDPVVIKADIEAGVAVDKFFFESEIKDFLAADDIGEEGDGAGEGGEQKVHLILSWEQFREFTALLNKLMDRFGTKDAQTTILAAFRALTND